MHNNSHSNLLCGIIYRHPNGDLERFIEYVSSTAHRINRENKTSIIMGDFNIDLLKFESHSATDGFLNTLGSNFFQPYILQPTRTDLPTPDKGKSGDPCVPMGDAWELDLVPRAYSPFKMAERHEEKR